MLAGNIKKTQIRFPQIEMEKPQLSRKKHSESLPFLNSSISTPKSSSMTRLQHASPQYTHTQNIQIEVSYRSKKQPSLPKDSVVPNPQTQASKAHKYLNHRINRNKTFRLSELYENFVALDHTTNKSHKQSKSYKLPDISSPAHVNTVESPQFHSDYHSSDYQQKAYHSNPQFYQKNIEARKQQRVDNQFNKFILKPKPDELYRLQKRYRQASIASSGDDAKIVAGAGGIFQPLSMLRKFSGDNNKNNTSSDGSQGKKPVKQKSICESLGGFIASPVIKKKQIRFGSRIKSVSSLSGIRNISPANIRNILPKSLQAARGGVSLDFDNIDYLGTCKQGRKEPPTLIKKNIRLINQVRSQNQDLAKQKEKIIKIKSESPLRKSKNIPIINHPLTYKKKKAVQMVVAAFKLKQQIAKYNQAMEVKDSEKQKRQLI